MTANVLSPSGTSIDGMVIPTRNEWLRHGSDNCGILVDIAAKHAQEIGSTSFPIVDAGCSAGRDVWMMAALLASRGLEPNVHGLDVNPEVLRQAQQPYKATLQQLADRLGRWGVDKACLDFFREVDDEHIEPTRELQESVGFHEVNLWTDDLAEMVQQRRLPPFNGVVINNVFCNLQQDRPDLIPKIVDNIVGGLGVGGIFTTLGTRYFEPEQHGLTPIEISGGRERFFRRQPSF